MSLALRSTAVYTPPAGSQVDADAAAPLGDLTASATATASHDATASAALGDLVASATAAVTHDAMAVGALGALAATAAGTTTRSATAAAALGGLSATATATSDPPSSGGSIRFDAAADRLTYTGSIPVPTGGLTITAWVKIVNDTNVNATFFRVYNSGVSTVITCATDTDGTSGNNYFTGGGSVSNAQNMGVGTWRAIAITHGTGTTGKAYVRIGSTTTVTSGTVSSSIPAGICVGGRDSSDATEGFDGEIAQLRIWSSEFSQAEIEAEWASPTPVITSGGYANWPLATATDLTDTIASRVLTTPNGTGQTTGSDSPPNTGGSVSAIAAAALGGLTAAATAVPSVDATASAALGSLSATAAADVSHDAVASCPLGALTAAAVGTTTRSAAADATLGALTATASADVSHPATATAPLGPLTADATAVVTPVGSATAAADLGALIASATVAVSHEGAGGADLGGLAADATALTDIAAAASAEFGGLVGSATGIRELLGIAGADLGSLLAAAIAVAHPPFVDVGPLRAGPPTAGVGLRAGVPVLD